jgi:Nucleotidyl transferase AbiEii toxin, Type IV TA system
VIGKTNLAASVAARLLNPAKQTRDDYRHLLTNYCLERFLYRLAESDRRDRFVLEGAILLRLWSERPYRATRDLELDLARLPRAGAARLSVRSRGGGEARGHGRAR